MHRFFLLPEACQGAQLTLTGAEARHALDVLRVRSGEAVTVLDGAGGRYTCTVADCDRRVVRLSVSRRDCEPPPPFRVTLVPSVTKSRSMDWMIQKATELGVHRIVPVITERSVPRLAREEASRKAERWREIAIESLKQCGTPWMPDVTPPAPLSDWLATRPNFDLALLASLHPGAQHPRPVLEAFRATHGRPPTEVAVWIGPEGDFTSDEIAAIHATGALPITLGPLVLRAETAAVYCLAFLGYELRA